MTHSQNDLQLEVEIFERLEVKSRLTLGEINRLRRKSRGSKKNLLFLAYEQGHIDLQSAQNIANELRVNTQKAPWAEPLQRPQGYPTFSQRPLDSFPLDTLTSVPQKDPRERPKKSHKSFDPKTQIEINIPMSIEQRNWTGEVDANSATQPQPWVDQRAHTYPQSSMSNHLISGNADTSPPETIVPPVSIESYDDLAHDDSLIAQGPSHQVATNQPIYANQNQSVDQLSTSLSDTYSFRSSTHPEEETTPPPKGPPIPFVVPSTLAPTPRPKNNTLISINKERTHVAPPAQKLELHGGERWDIESTPLIEHGVSPLNEVPSCVIWRAFDRALARSVHLVLEPATTAPRLLTAYRDLMHKNLRERTPKILDLNPESIEILGQDISTVDGEDKKAMTTTLYVIEEIEGSPISHWRAQGHELQWARNAQTFWQIVYTMTLVHQKGMLHLNLSPRGIYANISGLVTLGWWERAQLKAQAIPHHERDLFDLTFAAPELKRGETPSYQADVYSLGAIGFWILTRRPPPEDHQEVVRQLEELEFAPKNWVSSCISALHPHPKERPATANKLYSFLFGNEPFSLSTKDADQQTLDIILSIPDRTLHLAQILSEARIGLTHIHLIESLPPEVTDLYLHLFPRARLEIQNHDGAQSLGITVNPMTSTEMPHSMPSIELEQVSMRPPGCYRINWTIEGRSLNWIILIRSLERRVFTLWSPPPPQWVYIPEGPTCRGVEVALLGEQALHYEWSAAYMIATHLVSIQEYDSFLNTLSNEDKEARAPLEPAHSSQVQSSLNPLQTRSPRLGLSFEDVQAYCEWRGEVRLPTASEFDKAIRGESSIEHFSDAPLLNIADLSLEVSEFCTRADKPVLKGKRSSFDQISHSHIVAPSQKLVYAGFRLIQSPSESPSQSVLNLKS